MNQRIEIDVELQGDLVTDYPNKTPNRVENLKVLFRDENIAAKLESKLLDKLEAEYLEEYADDHHNSKYEYNGDDL